MKASIFLSQPTFFLFTWLTPDIPDSLVDLPGFSIARCDSKSTTKARGGGAALFVKSS